MTARSFKIGLCLTALFVLGAVCGTALSGTTPVRQAAKRWLPQGIERRMAAEKAWLDRMNSEERQELQLSEDQLEKLRPQWDKTRQRLETLREETGRQVRQIMKEHREAMLPLLTREQRETFRKLSDVRRQKAEKARAEKKLP